MKHIVNDTRLRSIFMALTGRALEVAIGTFILAFIFTQNLHLSFGIAVVNETLCALVTYLNERIWNKIQWGRRITHEGAPRTIVLKRGPYEAEVTLYKSGNVRVIRKNLVTNKEEIFQTRKKDGEGYIE